MIPAQGEPLTNADIERLLTSLAGSGTLMLLVTNGKHRIGEGILSVRHVPPGKELYAMENSAAVLPPTHQVHALYAGDLITMNGSYQP